jgi:hypothetical protein
LVTWELPHSNVPFAHVSVWAMGEGQWRSDDDLVTSRLSACLKADNALRQASWLLALDDGVGGVGFLLFAEVRDILVVGSLDSC